MKKALQSKIDNARTYEQWKEAAIVYDEHKGMHLWKKKEKTSLYDYASIRQRLDQLMAFKRNNDNQGMLFTLNEGIHGNLGGMGSSSLYQQAMFGTKQLIVDFVYETSAALMHLGKPRIKGVTRAEKVDFFHRASLCFGQSALLLSGSGSYLFFHLGVLKALWEQDLIPEVISGSSGGAFVAGIVGTRSKVDLGDIFTPEFLDLEKQLDTILKKYRMSGKVQVGSKELIAMVEQLVPDLTFEEAYNLSGIKINISVAPAEKHQSSRLLNAVTSPNVMVREAIIASCCLPGVFTPVTLAAKNVDGERVPYLPSRKWVDGSVADDLPMKRLSRLYAVNHFIVSQTNPIVLPFISAEKRKGGLVSTISKTSLKTAKDWGLAASHLLQRPLSTESYFSKVINGYISVVSQTYTGDINILPSKRFLNPAKALTTRTNEEILELIHEGERSTWPNIERIRIQTHISHTLSRVSKELDERIMKKSSASNKRKLKVVSKK